MNRLDARLFAEDWPAYARRLFDSPAAPDPKLRELLGATAQARRHRRALLLALTAEGVVQPLPDAADWRCIDDPSALAIAVTAAAHRLAHRPPEA